MTIQCNTIQYNTIQYNICWINVTRPKKTATIGDTVVCFLHYKYNIYINQKNNIDCIEYRVQSIQNRIFIKRPCPTALSVSLLVSSPFSRMSSSCTGKGVEVEKVLRKYHVSYYFNLHLRIIMVILKDTKHIQENIGQLTENIPNWA